MAVQLLSVFLYVIFVIVPFVWGISSLVRTRFVRGLFLIAFAVVAFFVHYMYWTVYSVETDVEVKPVESVSSK